MTEHQKYPMTMAHPAYKPSIPLPVPGTERMAPNGVLISQDFQGTPQMLPPVTVLDEEQEAYYGAQGYEPAGHSDPAAYAMAHASAPPPDYTPQEYPKMVGNAVVNSADEEAALRPVPTKQEVQAAYDGGMADAARMREYHDSKAAIHNDTVGSLRKTYEARFGKKPFMGWDADTLHAKLAA